MGKSQGGWRVFQKYRSTLKYQGGKVSSVPQIKVSESLDNRAVQDQLSENLNEPDNSLQRPAATSKTGVSPGVVDFGVPLTNGIVAPISSYASDEWDDILNSCREALKGRGIQSPTSVTGSEQALTRGKVCGASAPSKLRSRHSTYGSPRSSFSKSPYDSPRVSFSKGRSLNGNVLSERDGDARAPERRWLSDVHADAKMACSEAWAEDARARIQNAAWKVIEAQQVLQALNATKNSETVRKLSLDSKTKGSTISFKGKMEASSSGRRKSMAY